MWHVACDMLHENEQDIDLEEAVGSYLNCLSTGCAAGSKLYTSVGKIVDEKFHEIFPDQVLDNKLVKTCFQSLQIQNSFEGYQKALLECKDKLLEILIDNHTKKQQPSKESKNKKEISPEEQYAAVALTVAKELYCYHQTVAELLKPLLFSEFQEDFENATLTGVEGKDNVVSAWCTVVEANKCLRYGYGLTNLEIGQILSWQHGGDLSESCKKRLNNRINTLIQQYIDTLYSTAVCEEISIPLSYNRYPEDIQKLLQECCSPSEALAASSQGIPIVKEEIEVMLHRELPRSSICLNGRFFDKANPGKAFENTTLKMRAIREVIAEAVEVKKIGATKEQIDLFCLRVLATSSIGISYASSRTAVILAFGKANLIQVKPPLLNDEGEKVVYFNVHQDVIEIDIQSKWCITEDSTLFASLCRENTLRPIATVDVSYHVIIDIEDYLVKRIEPTPIAHITLCVLRQTPSAHQKKEAGRERSRSIKIKLTKATTKLFHRKSVSKAESEGEIITNEHAQSSEGEKSVVRGETAGNSSCESDSDVLPIPPPRSKRKAKKSRKAKDEAVVKDEKTIEKERKEKEEKKEDLGWFLSSPKFGIPPVAAISGSKDFSPSVASFEELQGVIDFLSGSSSSSLAVNEKGEKIRSNVKTHKRNNSTTSLQSELKHSKVTPEGKLKLCHKKSASFSGETKDMRTKESKKEKEENVKLLLTDANVIPSSENLINLLHNSDQNQTMDLSSESNESPKDLNSSDIDSPDSVIIKNVERTPGDGMDNKIDDKNAFTSTMNVMTTTSDADEDVAVDETVVTPINLTTSYSKDSDASITKEITSLCTSLGEITLVNSVETITKTEIIQNAKIESKEAKKFKTDPIVNERNVRIDIIDHGVQANVFESSIDTVANEVNNEPITSETNNFLIETDCSIGSRSELPSSKITSSDYEVEFINDIYSRGPYEYDRNLQYASSIDSRDKQGKMPTEAERIIQNRLLESDRSLQNRYSADIERDFQSKMLLEKNIIKAPEHDRSSMMNRSLGSLEESLQHLLRSEADKNLQGRMLDSGKILSGNITPESDRSDSKISSSISEFDAQSEEGNCEVLYEPFNSKWAVALGSKPTSWSDATFDTDCLSPKSEPIRPVKVRESEFTLDKQLDFNKLLEGSKFFAGHTTATDNWKDRSYLTGLPSTFDLQGDTYSQQYSMSSDPWPSQSNNHLRTYSPFSPAPSLQNQSGKRNIESLQLPPNPAGPYMRQNREQLLAKQQILEQYARHQKQLQLQQQQQQQLQQVHGKQIPQPPLTPTANLSSSMTSGRIPYSHSHERSNMSLPPGFSNERLTSSPQRFDVLSERHSGSLRPLSQQRSLNQLVYNNQFSSTSRSVSDIRMENSSGLLSERHSFSQMSEQNLFP